MNIFKPKFPKGIMSIYALSIISKRQFIIDIDSPCLLDQIYLPNKINWSPIQLKYSYTKNKKNISLDCMNFPRCLKRFNLANINSIDQYDSITINYNYDWLNYLVSNQYFAPAIQNLNLKQDFKLVYLFRKWFDELFKFSPHIQSKYDKFISDANLVNQTQIYCAQIRIGGKLANGKMDKVINEMNSTKLFWSFIRERFIKEANTSDWRVFVTSDFESIEKEALDEFGNNRVLLIKGANSHIDKELKTNVNDCSNIEKPMFDFHFMRNCQKAIVSNSGFGILGMWSRMEPVKDAYVFYKGHFKPLSPNTMPFG